MRCPECGEILRWESHSGRSSDGEPYSQEWYECCHGHKFDMDELMKAHLDKLRARRDRRRKETKECSNT